ncbi:MAG TPA: hypothetical protein PLX14_08035, partial [Anaerolineales bacterium]|nr:hypothetical protein [Anaerolineales bacterium]
MIKKIIPFALLFLSACQPAVATATAPASTTTPALAMPTSTDTPAEVAAPSMTTSPSATPAASNTVISTKDGMTQILIPAGMFFMGGMDVYRENDEMPAREVIMHAF